MKRLFFSLFTMALLFSACDKDKILSPEAQLKIDIEKIENYLKENNLTATKLPEGVFYLLEEEGEGTEFPTANSTVVIYYKGYFLDGTVFDESSRSKPADLVLSNTIQGWRIAMQKFKKGSKGKIFIPSGLGYGSYKYGSIPGKSVLIFDVEVFNFF